MFNNADGKKSIEIIKIKIESQQKVPDFNVLSKKFKIFSPKYNNITLDLGYWESRREKMWNQVFVHSRHNRKYILEKVT